MNTVDDRLERNLNTIAESLPIDDLAVARARRAIEDRPVEPAVRPRRWAIPAAAALVALVGAAAVWQVGIGGESGPSSSPATSPAAPPPTTVPPATTIPAEAQGPANVAILDPALGSSPTRQDPWFNWVMGLRSDPRRAFVRTDDAGVPTGSITVDEWLATEFEKSYSDSPSIDLGVAGIDARRLTFDGGGSIAWPAGHATVGVTWRGTATREEATAVATAFALSSVDAVAAPAGFSEVALPAERANVHYEDTSVNVDLAVAAPGQTLDAATLAFLGGSTIERVDGSVLVATPFPHDATTTAYRQVDPATVLTVVAPDEAGIDAVEAAATARVVPAIDVPIRVFGGPIVPVDADRAFGEIAAGRWYLATWTDTDGKSCWFWDTSFGGGGGSCVPPPAPTCHFAAGWAIDRGGYYYGLVSGRPSAVAISIDGADPVAASTLERSGDFTIAGGTAPETFQRFQIYIDGEPATCW